MRKTFFFMGIPFTLAGAFILYLAISWWTTYFASADWERTPVTLTKNEISRHSSSDSTTFQNDVAYHFMYNGTKITGNKAGMRSVCSSSYREYEERKQQLQHALDNDLPILAWVNPQQPRDSFLFREPGIAMYVVLPFGLVFLWPVWACLAVQYGSS